MFLLLLVLPTLQAAQIGLFPSSGCYSHNLMMRSVGRVFDNDTVSWIQTHLFDFGFDTISLPPDWTPLIMKFADERSSAAIEQIQRLIWTTVYPFDLDRWWDARGIVSFVSILRIQQDACLKLATSAELRRFLTDHDHMDLIIVDHILQECLMALTPVFNASSSVQVSNWPISDGYIASLNIPASSSSVPITGTNLPTEMNFVDRVRNTLFYLLLMTARVLQTITVNKAHLAIGNDADLLRIEAGQLIYAVQSEFLFSSVRPIGNQIKHFGCQRCQLENIQSSKVAIDEMQVTGIPRHLLLTPFVIVSFGSVASIQSMPVELLGDFMLVFGRLNRTVIWQFDGRPRSVEIVPENVHLFPWLPLKQLMGHRNAQLLICHGGITTLMEAIHRAIPILGIPLQGDQPSNMRRLNELGVSESIHSTFLSRKTLQRTLTRMISNIKSHQRRARQLSSMMNQYRKFAENSQQFWLRWALRNGAKTRNRPYFSTEYRGWFAYYPIEELTLLIVICIFVVLLIGTDYRSISVDRTFRLVRKIVNGHCI